MTQAAVIQVGQEALWLVLKIAGPVMFIGMIVGLVIALFQALTTIQELTLTFVPRIVVVFISMVFLLPFMSTSLIEFSTELFGRMSVLG